MYYELKHTTIRLAGSLHLVPAGSVIPAWVWDAYSWSEDIYLEANGDELSKYAFLPSGALTKDKLPSHLWPRLEAAWPAGGKIDSQKLWVVTMILATSGLGLVHGVEPQITRRAAADSRSIDYLETMSEFAALMDGVNDSVYVNAIAMLLADPTKRARDIADMYEAWITGDVEEIGAVMARISMAQFPEVQKVIFERRNCNWLPRIAATLSTRKRTLIIVGAGHLAGTSGLLPLLQRAGYEVSPIAH
jgi:uncharacterized protein YbaP (TraB family)